MSTRCTITVHTPRGAYVHLYRHHDGYLTQTGRDIAHALDELERRPISWDKASNVALRFVGLLANESVDRGPIPCSGTYELTSDNHGDTEFHYSLHFEYRHVSLDVFHRQPGDDWRLIYWGVPAGFRRLVARDLRDWWAELRHRRRKTREAIAKRARSV
jgi:hypothetical protein